VSPSTRERSKAIDAGACLGVPGPEFLKEGLAVRGERPVLRGHGFSRTVKPIEL
jgi:hypothetical protein